MASEAVLKYLKETNRPYSANDIVLNLHKEYGKAAVQKGLDEAVANGKVREKTYGKQKVYCVLQEDSGGGDDELKILDDEIKSKKEALSALEAEFRAAEATLKQLLAEPTTEEALEDNKRLREANAKLRAKLASLTESGTQLVSREEREAVGKERAAALKEYKKRKRLCNDMLEAVLEGGYPKGKKQLLEEIGIETDEAAGIQPFSV